MWKFWRQWRPAWNVLHEFEKAALAELPQERQSEAFLRLWTAKEAYLKALGVGLRREPSEICIRPRAEGFHVLDGGREIPTIETRLWRENVDGARLCLRLRHLAGVSSRPDLPWWRRKRLFR